MAIIEKVEFTELKIAQNVLGNTALTRLIAKGKIWKSVRY